MAQDAAKAKKPRKAREKAASQQEAGPPLQPRKGAGGLVRVTARDKRRALAAEARRAGASATAMGDGETEGKGETTGGAGEAKKPKKNKKTAAGGDASVAREAGSSGGKFRKQTNPPGDGMSEHAERYEQEGPDQALEDHATSEAPGKKRKRKRKRKDGQELATDSSERDLPEPNAEAPPVPSAPPAKLKKPKLTKDAAKELVAAESAALAEIYVEGLSFDAVEADVKAFFEPSGTVVEVRMPRYQDSGKPKGYCHVSFRSEDAADRAVKQNGAHMMGRYLKVERARVSRVLSQSLRGDRPPQPAGCKTVFVKNLPYDVTEDQMREAFMVCGRIRDVRLARHGHTNNLKGFGYVDFVTEDAAEVAVNKAAVRVAGRIVVVDYEQGKPKGSFKRSDGRAWKAGPSIAAR